MSTEVSLRAATIEDLPIIVALDQESFTQPWSSQTFADSLRDSKYLVVVAETSGSICGFGVAYTVGDEGEIATLAVAEVARGRGIGGRIVEWLCDECHRRGATQIFLEVRRSNTVAQRLYGRFGFERVGQRKNYYADGEDALLMKKTF